jgi:glyoxylase-like metal-dependent hydrolase (beta-lactamase superfamily II)
MEMFMSHNIYRVSLPLPFSLKQVSAYVIASDDKLTIIDTGLHTKATEEAWKDFFQAKQWDWHQVEKIILTHYHPDHIGFAGVLQKWTKAPVWIAKKEYEQIQQFWHPTKGDSSLVSHFFALDGFPREKLPAIDKHMKDFCKVIEPYPSEYRWLDAGGSIEIGNTRFQLIATPGHSQAHVSLFAEKQGIFFAGDVLLPKITPNIPALPNSDPNPLATFLSTLDKISCLDINMVYPGHGEPFSEVKQRIEEIKQHHDHRLQKIVELVKDKQQMTGYQVCEQLFQHRKLDTHNLRFAFSETIAHLEYLRYSGSLRKSENKGIFHYQIG